MVDQRASVWQTTWAQSLVGAPVSTEGDRKTCLCQPMCLRVGLWEREAEVAAVILREPLELLSSLCPMVWGIKLIHRGKNRCLGQDMALVGGEEMESPGRSQAGAGEEDWGSRALVMPVFPRGNRIFICMQSARDGGSHGAGA